MDNEQLVDDTRPFDGLKISDCWIKLNDLDERSTCEKCKKSRKYFCYTCYIPVSEIKDDVPKIKLPLKVDIIKHNKEIDGKSTATHAAVISPEDVNIYTYPAIPNYNNNERILLVFPCPKAKSVEDIVSSAYAKRKENENQDLVPFERVIFIDSTWNQCKGIHKDPRIFNLGCVVLRNRITQFWRHQNGSPRWYLSTIEAIHQFFVEYKLATMKLNQNIEGSKEESVMKNSTEANVIYDGQYDNLLFFFKFMYYKIHTLYDHDTLRSYKRPLT